MTLLYLLRLLSVIMWFTVGCYRAGAFVRIYRGNARYYDELAAMISAMCFLFFGFSLRWFLPNPDAMLIGLYPFSFTLAIMVIRSLRRYEQTVK